MIYKYDCEQVKNQLQNDQENDQDGVPMCCSPRLLEVSSCGFGSLFMVSAAESVDQVSVEL